MKVKLLLLTFILATNLQAQNRVFGFLQNEKSNSEQSVLVFYKPDCPYCLKMEQTISKDILFQQSVKNNYNVIVLDINSAEGKRQASLYNIKAVPTIVKLDHVTNAYKIQKGFNSNAKLASFLAIDYLNPNLSNKNIDGVPAVCGNGTIESPEQCDDGNVVSGDGCNATCQNEVGICGNGITEIGEQCDDANTTNGDGCSATCQFENVAVCGDGIVQAGEQCDDANITNGDGCSATCQLENVAVCGDGIVQAGEQCDDANVTNGDGCSATCQLEGSSANDDCAGAFTLTVGATFQDNAVTGTTIGATTDAILIPDCQSSAYLDTWYKVIVPASGTVTIETQQTEDTVYLADSVLTVYTGSCGNLTELDCNDDASGLMSTVTVSEQTPGTILYVAVWAYGVEPENSGTFLVSAYSVPAPDNDNCSTAAPLIVGGTFESSVVIGSTTGATTTSVITPECQSNAGSDVWYQIVVPQSGSVTIEAQITSPEELYDSVIGVYSGSCDSLTQVGCNDDGGEDDNALMSKVVLTGQTPGATLFVGIWQYGTNVSNAGAFQLAAYDASLANPTFDTASFSMYPNPVKDVLNISYAKTISKVQIYSILGQEVITKSVNENQNQINMSGLASGAYFVKITSDGLVKTMKVIKQ